MNLEGMNPAQIEATTHVDGPCCVIAGAGSGKTRVLTHRIGYLIERGIPSESILACTFTKKAAGEMAERLEPLVGPEADLLNLGTIHSMCYRILREEWRHTGESYEILNDYWQKRFIKDILAPAGPKNPDGMNWGYDVSAALGFIGGRKNELVTPEMFRKSINYEIEDAARLARLYELYEARKEREGRIDFDDMLIRCYYLLAENPAILTKYQQRYKYILVDEFQDTNRAQWEIIRMLAEPENNLFVVGDDWQSIYGFRGARPEYIVHFEKWYPDAKIVVLDTNYRCNEQIISISNAVIQHNTDQYPKKVLAHRGAGQLPMMFNATDEEHEADLVIREMQALMQVGKKPGEIAVLYRTNAQSRAYEDKLVRANIPYTIIGSAGFYSRKEVRDMISYLQVIHNPAVADDAIKRVLNVPSRFLGRALINDVESYSIQYGLSFWEALQTAPGLRPYQRKGISEFVDVIHYARRNGSTPAELIQLVREITEYDDWIRREDGEDDGENARIENLNELQSAASRYRELDEFLNFVEMMCSRSATTDDDPDRVQLMTIHRSKGLEFPAVFLVGLNNGLLPHKKSIEYADGVVIPSSCAEERRLCYVGMTRAKDLLYLSHMESYQGRSMDPSIFLEEMHQRKAI
ncbi:ATP-dependent helicase [Paenibacillus thiaminolyticus]|uniref:ATP-dependent helicase n=1 Tax=Paenibacillus thiaminolyticus TaxID=49283 RepID=UPI002542B68D|nr:UvrD-helicase domain-containing protein [Paenibacillus thiaminolyticus]WII39678.1 UvrD-helicase domain-containing protein [Paenibacillus thiaminolyticus]